MMPQLTKAPSVDVGLLIRRSPHDVFEALADPSITTRFWYTKSTGRMVEGTELTWEWEMYDASGKVWVRDNGVKLVLHWCKIAGWRGQGSRWSRVTGLRTGSGSAC